LGLRVALSQNAVNAALPQFNGQAEAYRAATDDDYIGLDRRVNAVCHVMIFKIDCLWVLYEYLFCTCRKVLITQSQSTTQHAKIHAICVA
jgi:hypothetical protein